MAYLIIEDFRRGLDRRKLALGAAAGTLVECTDGHITALGEIEKRKAFVAFGFTSGYILDGNGDQGLFGLQETATGLTVFGSALVFGTSPTLSQPVLASAIPVTSPAIAYQQLKHPAIVEGQTYDRTKHRMTALIASELFSGAIFAVAKFADGRRFGYYDGSLVVDLTAGLILEHLAGQNTLIAEHLKNLVNRSPNYTATRSGSTVTISGQTGMDFDVDKTLDTAAGTLTLANTVQPVAPRDGVSAAGSFKIMAGSAAVASPAAATGTVTRSGTAPTDGQKVTIGGKVYTFKTALSTPLQEGQVLIGGSATNALANLKKAINREATYGTDHACFEAHPYVTAGTIAGSALPLTAAAGSTGNSVALSTDIGTWSVSGANMTGGAGNCISQVKIVSPAQAATNLLSSAVAFSTSKEATATAVAAAINANTSAGLTHGYSATASENGVSLFSSTSGSPMPNGYGVQVQVGGNVCVGDCMFYFTQKTATAFTIGPITVNGIDILGGTTFSTASYATFAELYAAIADDINAESGFRGVTAFASPTFLQVSQIITKSTDAALPVYVTITSATNGGVVFGAPPESPVSLSVTLTGGNIFHTEDLPGDQINPTGGVNAPVSVTSVDTAFAQPVGGSGSYSYLWQEEFSGSGNLSTTNPYYSSQTPGNGSWNIKPVVSTAQGTRFVLNMVSGGTTNKAGDYIGRWVCKVTDSLGKVIFTDTVVVTFVIR